MNLFFDIQLKILQMLMIVSNPNDTIRQIKDALLLQKTWDDWRDNDNKQGSRLEDLGALFNLYN